jgi:DNA-binding NarL/FixJ family response regulator
LRRTAVVIDEQPLWLSGLESVLARTDVEVLAKTTSLSDGLDLAERMRPDLVVASIDGTSGDLDGLGFLRRVREVSPPSRTIVFSNSSEANDIDAALRAGAVAYVIKTARPEDFAVTVRQAFQQSIFLERPAASEPLAPQPTPQPAHMNGNGATPPLAPGERGLTRRELEILRLVADGKTNADVAGTLWVTEETVKFHLSNTYRKIGVSNRTEASRWAHVNGLLSADADPVAAA